MRSSALLLLLALGAGCARTTMQASVADAHGGAGATAELDFWEALATKRAVTNHDALHALVLSFGDRQAAKGFEAHVAVARERGWIRGELAANETAKVGWIARAVCKETGIRGGLTMRVLGPAPRYAVRELNQRGWLPDLSTTQAISGLQLLALLGKAEEEA